MKYLRTALLAISFCFSLFQNTALAGYAEGYAAYKKQNFATALHELRPLASKGHDQSQYIIGLMYYNGEGVTKNYTEAMKWFHLAANQGNAIFQFLLGYEYANGQAVAQDYKEAVKWYRLAANQGHASAQNDLGASYANGRGVMQDDQEAVRWYRLAANQGNENAKTNLANYERRREEQIADSKRKEEESARTEEAKRNAEKVKHLENEIKLRSEEIKRLEGERKNAERNFRIASWIAVFLGLAGVLIFFFHRRKHGAVSKEHPEKKQRTTVTPDSRLPKTHCLKCGYQRTPSDIGPEISCPKCGGVYAKVEAALAEKIRSQGVTPKPIDSTSSLIEDSSQFSKEIPEPISFSSRESKVPNEKHCNKCSVSINLNTEICPKCRTRQTIKSDTNNEKIDTTHTVKSASDIPVLKKKSNRPIKILALICGIGIVASIVLPLIGGEQNRSPVAASESQSSADDICRDKGDDVAKVYFANLQKMIANNITAIDMMSEACIKKTEGTECQKLCQDGFKYRSKQFLKN